MTERKRERVGREGGRGAKEKKEIGRKGEKEKKEIDR